MSRKIYLLVDCNNFYVSCERVFDPHLRNHPVAVLTNNDGLMVSRSQEVKDLGISMCEPVFKCGDLIRKHKIVTLSSNYTLYADMSCRVMNAISSFGLDVEIYSIDEAFVSLSETNASSLRCSLADLGKQIKDRVYQWTGIPVSVGIAETKTLAKVANEFAKKIDELEGVLDLTTISSNQEIIDEYLRKTKVIDIWGVGRSLSSKLLNSRISNAFDLKKSDLKWVKKNMSISGVRTVLELRNISCISLSNVKDTPKSLVCSQSFAHDVSLRKEILEAISGFVANACERLRQNNCVCSIVQLFIYSNRFKNQGNVFGGSTFVRLPYATDLTTEILKHVLSKVDDILSSGVAYKKAGVCLSGIQEKDSLQFGIFDPCLQSSSRFNEKLINSIDKINKFWGRDTIKLAVQGVNNRWRMLREKLSQRYTTDWLELPVVS
ncbi:Y-family DNA polymerase [Candidatus Dojkabacteria bacterium]|nr:Y-family DNA polymerase [Candidatus Dojkabacteria bacterium]